MTSSVDGVMRLKTRDRLNQFEILFLWTSSRYYESYGMVERDQAVSIETFVEWKVVASAAC